MINSNTDRTKPVDVGDYFTWTDRSGRKNGDRWVTLDTETSIAFLSFGNPFRNGHYTSGGSFVSAKRLTTYQLSNAVSTYRANYALAYRGHYMCPAPGTIAGKLWSKSSIMTDLQNLSTQGAQAWNRMRPDNPDFSFATSFYELKDVPQQLKDAVNGIRKAMKNAGGGKSGKSIGNSPSKAGQFYLAVQFGWLPLLSDILNFVEAHRNGQKRLRQLIRDNGRPIRRRTTLFDGNIAEPWSSYIYENDGYGGDLMPVHVTQCYIRFADTYKAERRDSYRKIWGEGQFRYHLPPGPRDVVWKKKMLRRIMGARVTPDMVYNIMPWSWLVDYFTSLGEFVKAVSPGVADRLAADYCYIMSTTTITHSADAKVVVQGALRENTNPVPVTASTHSIATAKLRNRASPFGWGVNQNSLTPKQWAILGALGLSKLP